MGLGFLVFPELCPVCERLLVRGERHICLGCLSDLPYSHFWCWRNNPAEQMLGKIFSIDMVASLLFYRRESRWKAPIHQFKYYGKRELGAFLSSLLAKHLYHSGWSSAAQVVVPVPLHWYKEWIRGFNQAEIIAQEVAKELNIRIEPHLIKRKRYTFTQTRKNRKQRQKGVANAFAIRERFKKELIGKKVLLVDDILTTGATVEACSKILLEAGALNVSVVTLAFVE